MSKNILQTVFCVLFIWIFFISAGFSQEEPKTDFGEFSVADFNKTNLGADTGAAAVILYDIGDAYFNNYLEVEYTRQIRIKILNKAGYDWGTVRIKYNRNKDKEIVENIDGYTAYLDENGKVIKKELNSDDIFDEEINSIQSVKSFTLPSLRPGCIIEYRFKVRSDYMTNFPREWNFQYDIPVLWSEFKTEVPAIYTFVVFEQQKQLFYIDEKEEYSKSYSLRDASQVSIMLSGLRRRQVMRNVPALHEEPYMKSINDYRAMVTYQLAGYHPPSSSSQKISESWKDVGATLMEDESFGGRLEGTDKVKEMAQKLTDTLTNADAKVLKIFDFIRNSFVYNNGYSIYASDLDELLKKKKGDTGDINLLLAAMLKSVGIEAHPVILSTRDNGEVYTKYPILSQFNDIIVYVKTNGGQYVLDATDRLRPYYIISKEALSDFGLMIMDDDVQWVQINPAGKDLEIKVASVLIKSNGGIEGIMRIKDEDYAAMDARQTIENGNNDAFMKQEIQTDISGVKASSIKLTDYNDPDKPLLVDANIAADNYSQVSDDFIYVNPYFLGRIQENPFKLKERIFPVDYAYPIDYTYKVNVTLPNGYSVKDYPKTKTIKLNDDDGGYVREVTLNGNLLQFASHFYINKVTFKADEYQKLKDFYDQVVSLDGEQIVLQKQK